MRFVPATLTCWALLICVTFLPTIAIERVVGQEHTALLGDRTFPEGITAHAGSGHLFVGGLADGSIQRIVGGRATYFKTAHQDDLMNVIGMTVDATRNRLWVCSVSFMDAFEGNGPTTSEVLVFDTESASVVARFRIPNDGLRHFVNDVTVDRDGNAYITGSFAPVLYAVAQGIVRVELNADYTTALAQYFPAERWDLDFPTTGVVVDDNLVVTNSQLNHYLPVFDNPAPPTSPFRITAIPLREIR